MLRELDVLRPLIMPNNLAQQAEPALLLKLLEIVHFRTGGRMGDWTQTLKQVCLDALQTVEDLPCATHYSPIWPVLAATTGPA
ncbi:MAG: hypothetical protein R3F53_26525 [Gammaproteobacteria bacterium]